MLPRMKTNVFAFTLLFFTFRNFHSGDMVSWCETLFLTYKKYWTVSNKTVLVLPEKLKKKKTKNKMKKKKENSFNFFKI